MWLAIFMEHKLRFGLVLGWLAVPKKTIWVHYEQLLRAVFHVFMGSINIFYKYCSIHTKKLQKTYSIMFCSTRDTSLQNLYIVTLSKSGLKNTNHSSKDIGSSPQDLYIRTLAVSLVSTFYV